MDKPVEKFAPEALRLLEAYDWPGNVRELENTIERAMALESSQSISVEVLPEKISRFAQEHAVVSEAGAGNVRLPPEGVDFEKLVQHTERAYLLAALESAGGVRIRAAELLGMRYRSFRHYAKKHNI
jgi:two-component system response regulator PilR (NtrC family)